jgi:hypothetical protein
VRIELPQALVGVDVCLRPLRSEDVSEYTAAFAEDPDLGRLLGIEEDPTEQTVLGTVASQGRLAEEGKGVDLAIANPVTHSSGARCSCTSSTGITAGAISASG